MTKMFQQKETLLKRARVETLQKDIVGRSIVFFSTKQ